VNEIYIGYNYMVKQLDLANHILFFTYSHVEQMSLVSFFHTLDPSMQNAHFSHITVLCKVVYIIIGLYASTRITLILGSGLHNIKILLIILYSLGSISLAY